MANYWQPYVCNVEKWKRHFQLVGDGKIKPQERYYVTDPIVQKGRGPEPIVKLETPVQAAIFRAKSELNHNSNLAPNGSRIPIKRGTSKKTAHSKSKPVRQRTGRPTPSGKVRTKRKTSKPKSHPKQVARNKPWRPSK